MKPRLTVFSLMTSIFLLSCGKHVYNERWSINPLIGTWSFTAIDAKTQSSQEFKLAGFNQKNNAELDYITENNSGKVIFFDSTITAYNLSYTISSEIRTYNYKNGVLADSNVVPYELTFFEPESSCKYKMIGNDSVYFPKGGFTNIAASTLRTDPLKAKVTFEGSTVKLTEAIYKDTTIVKLGVAYHTIQTGTAIMTLSRD